MTGVAETLEAVLVADLARNGQTVAVAESCTGGGLGARLTSVPGASAVFPGGVIAYSDDVKRTLLAVSAEALAAHGAVSRAIAEQMAASVRALCGTDWGVGITGVAGPSGGSEAKPVGTVWIAVAGPAAACARFAFDGERRAVREKAVEEAMAMLRELVESGHD